ncbi:MAG: hypothetical protein Q7S84_01005 [bacterium]|nr:hypothetical protein [bacterium]
MERSVFADVEMIVLKEGRTRQNALSQRIEETETAIVEEGQRKPKVVREITTFFGFEREIERQASVPSRVASLAVEKEGFKKSLDSYSIFSTERLAFLQSLTEKGIQPIAVLPRALWNELMREFGLIRFEHVDKDGKTGVNLVAPEFLVALVRAILGAGFVTGVLALVASFLIAIPITAVSLLFTGVAALILFEEYAQVRFRLPDGLAWFTALFASAATVSIGMSRNCSNGELVVVGIVGGFVLILLSYLLMTLFFLFGKKPGDYKEGFAPQIIEAAFRVARWKMFSLRSHAKQVRFLWPDSADTNGADKVTVRFPKAPKGFVDTLVKLQEGGQQPMIAAVPEAVMFNSEEAKCALDEQTHRLFADPILFTADKKWVAVVAQFGDFPREQEVVAWVKQNFNLCFN